ncbi:Transglycosylase SLT domain protein [Rubellimicrobium thermophilum DSM 16684]|uniref:Transglycosylase SLT domain protein n=2 Tax=Rubellimicrobium TaxID=295418 RepID=S9R0M8_9RHOB|nr:Transglycosylase SLT domain protein [Rubellimicrobium thermophilum DSM 16684]
MHGATLVARWTLGGSLALFAGLAAVAEPPVPLRSVPVLSAPVLPAARSALALPLRITIGPARPPPGTADRASPGETVSPVLSPATPPVVAQRGAPLRPVARGPWRPPALWDPLPEGRDWTQTALEAMAETSPGLPDLLPADIGDWCPGYPRASKAWRAAFWIATISALARRESNHDPQAVGGGGAWHGLLQIAPATARGHGCEADTPAELADGRANLACAVRIMTHAVARDGVVAAGGGGLAADWGPMSREAPREAIRQWVRDQPYCEVQTAVATALRPLARPGAASIRLAAR